MNFAEINEKLQLWEGKIDGESEEGVSLLRRSSTMSLEQRRRSVTTFSELNEKQKQEAKVSFETLYHLFQAVGGIKPIISLIIFQFTLHYLDVYTTKFKGAWANVDE